MNLPDFRMLNFRPTMAVLRKCARALIPRTVTRPLPAAYRVLPNLIVHHIPGFRQPGDDELTFAPEPIDCSKWFDAFVNRVVSAIGRRYLPVCRMSDGEYLFLFGHVPPDPRYPIWSRLPLWCWQALLRIRDVRLMGQVASVGYARPEMSNNDVRAYRPRLDAQLRTVAQHGVLAMHLTEVPWPFQERYYRRLKIWLQDNGIKLSVDNYVPFYFVYAALSGPRRFELLSGRRVLLVNSADDDRRSRIEDSLRRNGVVEFHWIRLSQFHSHLDALDLSPFVGKVDIALVAASIGKGNVLVQLRQLSVPCIDVGFMMEVWARPELANARPFCSPVDAPVAAGPEHLQGPRA